MDTTKIGSFLKELREVIKQLQSWIISSLIVETGAPSSVQNCEMEGCGIDMRNKNLILP